MKRRKRFRSDESISESNSFYSPDPPSSGGSITGNNSGMETPSIGAFYMLRKETEARSELHRILKSVRTSVVIHWRELILEDDLKPSLYKDNSDLLNLIMDLFLSYLMDFDKEKLKNDLTKLHNRSDYPHMEQSKEQLIIYSLKVAIENELRKHVSKPHLLLAWDKIIGNAVSIAVNIICKDNDPQTPAESHYMKPFARSNENTGDSDRRPLSRSTGITGVESYPNENEFPAAAMIIDDINTNDLWQPPFMNFNYKTEISKLQEENNKLFHDLYETTSEYNRFLKHCIREKKNHIEYLRSTIGDKLATDSGLSSQVSTLDSDENLKNWLQEIGISSSVISVIINEEFTFQDFVYFVTKEDLYRLQIKGGIVLKIWAAVERKRKENSNEYSTFDE